MDTAAVMENLDLIITTDTAAAHLAGGLGVPVWTALAYVADWRWLLDREETPWYPTMRLFRQTEPGNWSEVFERMTRELKQQLAAGAPVAAINVEVSPGELIDKITILEIKAERVVEPAKLQNIRVELATLTASRDKAIVSNDRLAELTAELKAINAALWEIEDDLRECERTGDFGPRFVELARSVYRQNDRRSEAKRKINELLGSKLIEEKAYKRYE